MFGDPLGISICILVRGESLFTLLRYSTHSKCRLIIIPIHFCYQMLIEVRRFPPYFYRFLKSVRIVAIITSALFIPIGLFIFLQNVF